MLLINNAASCIVSIMISEPSENETHEFESILNYIHHTLCDKDKRDKKAGRVPKWQSYEEIVKKWKAFLKKQTFGT